MFAPIPGFRTYQRDPHPTSSRSIRFPPEHANFVFGSTLITASADRSHEIFSAPFLLAAGPPRQASSWRNSSYQRLFCAIRLLKPDDVTCPIFRNPGSLHHRSLGNEMRCCEQGPFPRASDVRGDFQKEFRSGILARKPNTLGIRQAPPPPIVPPGILLPVHHFLPGHFKTGRPIQQGLVLKTHGPLKKSGQSRERTSSRPPKDKGRADEGNVTRSGSQGRILRSGKTTRQKGPQGLD